MKKSLPLNKILLLLAMVLWGLSSLQAQVADESSLMPDELSPVTSLEAQNTGNDTVFLAWNFPEDYHPAEMNLSWSGALVDSAGVYGDLTCSVAHRYDIHDIHNFIGWKLKDISIIPCNSGYSWYVRSWKGKIDELELTMEQFVDNPIIHEKNTIAVNADVYIEDNAEFWVGYFVEGSGGYPFAMSDEPIVMGKGNLIRLTETSDWFLDTNISFWIEATIESPEGKTVTLGSKDIRRNELTGYKVYADDHLIAEIDKPFLTYYFDDSYAKGTNVNYCVTAVYGTEESEPACVTVEILSTEDYQASGDFNVDLYPNPCANSFALQLPIGTDCASVELYNLQGRLVSTQSIGFENISTEHLAKGTYLVKVTLADGKVVTEKIVKE